MNWRWEKNEEIKITVASHAVYQLPLLAKFSMLTSMTPNGQNRLVRLWSHFVATKSVNSDRPGATQIWFTNSLYNGSAMDPLVKFPKHSMPLFTHL